MVEDQIRNHLEQLRKQINFHNYQYHTLDKPLISDTEFDQLMLELKKIETEHPELITSDSPSQRTGAKPLEKFRKVNHPAPILSLANGFGTQDIRDWIERIKKIDAQVVNADFVVEPKIDGLTVVLHYINGQFILGATRGDGEVGEDITENLRTIHTIPLTIPIDTTFEAPESIVIRGEVYIAKEDFDLLNRRLVEKGEKVYLNPRNTAAGSLRQLDPQITAQRPLKILVYQIISSSSEKPKTQWETLTYLRKLGLPVSNLCAYAHNIEEAIDICEKAADQRENWPFEADGTVIKINDLQLSDNLGFVGKDPRGSIAYKYPTKEVTTKLEGISINVGRTGVLTPQALLDPVMIGGVVVKQATLHNFDFIKEKDIRIGDRVLVKRAGEVIPYIIGPVIDARSGSEQPFFPPEKCPACGENVEKILGEVAWYCVNNTCPAQLVRNIEHFVSRGAMDIVGLGYKIVEQLIQEDLVKDVADLYTLKKEDLLKLEGFAHKKVENLLTAIESSKGQTLDRLITALGIRGVGEVAARDLAEEYLDLDALAKATQEDIQNLQGFGPNIAQSIVDWFARPTNQNLIKKLKVAGVWPINQPETNELDQNQLQGLTFVITGTLPTLSREDASGLILLHGGKISSSVSKNTSFLLLGADPGSKYQKAQQLGIPIISEEELLKKINA